MGLVCYMLSIDSDGKHVALFAVEVDLAVLVKGRTVISSVVACSRVTLMTVPDWNSIQESTTLLH